MNRFYVLELTAEPVETTKIEYKHVNCENCGVRPMGRIGNMEINFELQIQMADFAWNSDGIFVTEVIFKKLNESKITGWRQGYLDASMSQSNLIKVKYFELVVIGKTQNYALETGIKPVKQCPVCGYKKYDLPRDGLYIPEQCWDRSDIFYIHEFPGIPIITQQTTEWLLKNDVSGIDLIPADQWFPPLYN